MKKRKKEGQALKRFLPPSSPSSSSAALLPFLPFFAFLPCEHQQGTLAAYYMLHMPKSHVVVALPWYMKHLALCAAASAFVTLMLPWSLTNRQTPPS